MREMDLFGHANDLLLSDGRKAPRSIVRLHEFPSQLCASEELTDSIRVLLACTLRGRDRETDNSTAAPAARTHKSSTEEETMRRMIIAAALVSVVLVPTANAQHRESDVSTAPSAQNSGAGISGQPGSKSGPAAKSGTVGSSSSNQGNPAVQQQDPAKIPGLPGNKSGPPEKQPSRR